MFSKIDLSLENKVKKTKKTNKQTNKQTNRVNNDQWEKVRKLQNCEIVRKKDGLTD